jgi:hypothetical protein
MAIVREAEKYHNAFNAVMISTVYTFLKDKDNAIRCIEDAYTLRSDFFPWYQNNPVYKFLHDDPRFQELVGRLKLPE